MGEMSPEAAGIAALNNAFSGETQDPTPAPVVTEPPVQQPSNSGGHPAWQEILNTIPASLHDSVRPTLEQWDKGVEDKLNKVHSQYAPYKQFLDNGISPDVLDQGVRFVNALNNDPQKVYEQLAEYLGVNSGQGQQNAPEVDLGEGQPQQVSDPRIDQLTKQQEQILNTIQQAQAAEQQRQMDAWLEQKVTSVNNDVKTKHGIDLAANQQAWRFIMSQAAMETSNNQSLDPNIAIDNAVSAYMDLVGQVRASSASNNAPKVMPPSGGGVPTSNSVDITKMSDKERRTLGAEMLQQALRDT